MRHDRHIDDDDERQNIVRDGGRVRVPLHMMDGMDDPVQRSIARNGLRVTDGSGDSAGLHRPGPRYIADAAMRDAKQAAYDAYLHDVTNAWRGAPARDELQRDALPARENLTFDQIVRDHDERAGRAYQSYDTELQNAWRNP